MSEYEDLKDDLLTVMDSVNGYGAAVNRYADAVNEQVEKLWQDNAELRDELHALANRVETLTRARLTEPAEVAERMIFVCRLNPGCNVSRPHIHHDDGAVVYVDNEATADAQLQQRAFLHAIRDRKS